MSKTGGPQLKELQPGALEVERRFYPWALLGLAVCYAGEWEGLPDWAILPLCRTVHEVQLRRPERAQLGGRGAVQRGENREEAAGGR